MGPRNFYEQRYVKDVIDQLDEASGSATYPILLKSISPNESQPTSVCLNPSDDSDILSDTASSIINSPSSADRFLRIDIENFGENAYTDSELFNAKLKNFISGDKN